ncbi:MAG: hypothetical protein MRJ66_20090 [Nitrospira sp.]|nr:hypothetical protein [Nitrospira sp.]MDR4466557.1 hypothetical protein [Nitrospira sp.]
MKLSRCGSPNLGGFQDVLAHHGPIVRRQARARPMATERDGLTQGRDEDFTVGTASQMSANFVANVSCKFIIDIGGQLTENVQASAFPVVMLMPSC